MLLKVKSLGLCAGRPIAILHSETAKALNVHVDERVKIRKKKKSIVAIVDIATGMLGTEEIILSEEIMNFLGLEKHDTVDVGIATEPRSIAYIREKIKGLPLSNKKIRAIITDIVFNRLTESEIAYFVAAVYIHRMNMKEIESLIKAIVDTGKKLQLKKKIIADKHGIGGIAGNRTTPIVVSIAAAAGLAIPKTSSRAITSAAGTADVIETIAKVEFSVQKIKQIITKAQGCMVWGGALGLAPADDKIIQVERLLRLDPESQLIASILSKKVSVGATHVVLDIPCGKGVKFTKTEAEKLAKKFLILGKKFKIKIKPVITDGSQPIGRGVGPVLEMRDVLSVLRQEPNRPLDLEKKALLLVSLLLELTGKAKKGKGMEIATKLLRNGTAYKKFLQIIALQQEQKINEKELEQLLEKRLGLAKFNKTITAQRSGKIKEIDNKKINILARAAGAPAAKTAGLYLWHHCNEHVKKGEKLITIYAESQERLKNALELYKSLQPISLR